MKLCVIGNSHAGMLAAAFRDTPLPGAEVTFFARQGKALDQVRLRAGELRMPNRDARKAMIKMGMPGRIRVDAFDAFVIVGMTATAFALAPMVAGHAVYGWPSAMAEIEATGQTARPLMSEPALEAALRAAIEGNTACAMIAKIRKHSRAPILLVPQPYPSEDVLARKDGFLGFRLIHRRGDGVAAAAALEAAHTRAFAPVDALHILRQPSETIAHGFLTASDFTRGATRLNVTGKQPEADILHANAAYGRLVAGQIEAMLEGFSVNT